jgi:RNA polymerase sigma factor (sigma-70 family)
MPPKSFEEAMLPHLDAAFNYARWLTRSDADAEDVVQDAYMRAMKFFSSFRGENAQSWLLTIVRNTWYGRFPKRANPVPIVSINETVEEPADVALDPEALVMRRQTVERVRHLLEELPADFREVIVLRELEGLSYREIATVVGIPIGTVMSRLARARERLMSAVRASSTSGADRAVR